MSSDSFWFALAQSGGNIGYRVSSSSRGFTAAHLGFDMLIRFAWVHYCASRCRRVRVGSLWHSSVSPASFGSTSDHPRGHRFHLGLRGFIRARLEFAGFIRVRVGSLKRGYKSPFCLWYLRVYSGAPMCRRGSRGFIRAPLGVVRFIVVRMS